MQQALKIATVVMGVMIVMGVTALVVLIAKGTGRTGSGGGAAVVSRLEEPGGTRIVGMSLSGTQVGLRLEGGGADRVVVVDTRSGHVVARVGLAP